MPRIILPSETAPFSKKITGLFQNIFTQRRLLVYCDDMKPTSPNFENHRVKLTSFSNASCSFQLYYVCIGVLTLLTLDWNIYCS